LFSEVKVAEENGEVGGKGSGDTTTVDIRTLLEAIVIMSLRSACCIDEAFLGGDTKQNLLFWNYLHAMDYQDF
jgi:hypothetical protein